MWQKLNTTFAYLKKNFTDRYLKYQGSRNIGNVLIIRQIQEFCLISKFHHANNKKQVLNDFSH